MGLLSGMGLHLGEVLPPAPENPRGFFENQHVVQMNRRILARMDRDWTCPPRHLDLAIYELEPLRGVLEPISAKVPWGFKDPRTLFTLPLWAAAAGEVRLVGVHRNTGAIARSLAKRNGFTAEEASLIATTYAERLAAAHRILGFPIVAFDESGESFLSQTRKIAESIGLYWDHGCATDLFDPTFVHHQGTDSEGDEVDRYLNDAAQAPFESVPTFSADRVITTWDRVSPPSAGEIPTYLGPRYTEHRADLIRDALSRHTEVGGLEVVDPDRRERPVPGVDPVTLTGEDLLSGPSPEHRVSHLVAPRLLDEIPPKDLPVFFDAIVDRLDRRALVELGGWVVVGDYIPESQRFSPADVTAFRDEPPYLHHLDEITTVALRTPLALVSLRRTPGGRVQLVFDNMGGADRLTLQPSSLRHQLDAEREKVESLSAELRELTSELESQRRQIQDLRDEAAESQASLARLEAESSARREEFRRNLDELTAEREKSTRLARERDEARRSLDEVRRSLQSMKSKLTKAQRARAAAERSQRRLENRRIVRFALALARPAKPLFRLVRRVRSRAESEVSRTDTGVPAEAGSPRRTAKEIVDGVRNSRPDGATQGPLVSIVILTHNGAHHLRRLLPALEKTSYRSFEVVVVDNASADDTSEILFAEWNFPVRVLENESNSSFSAGNNSGVRLATGEYLLFLNNDVEPINPGWLGNMVSAFLTDSELAGVGTLLVYPERGDPATDLTVQHAGVELRLRDGAPHAANVSHPDPLSPELRETWDVTAATAAALMVPSPLFEEVGGFEEGYVYGAEDVDLCLKLGEKGRLAVTGGAVLFHHESATQSEVAVELTRINRIGNWQLFAERWGPRVVRSVRADLLTDRPSDRQRTVAITLTRDNIESGWGDYYTAHELGDVFAAQGWDVVYAERYQDGWYELGDDVDLVISLLDSYDIRRAPASAFTIAWVRNWVDRWIDREWFGAFDLVMTSSHQAAERIQSLSGHSPTVIPLATNHERFTSGSKIPTFECDFTFTGNNWGAGREVIPKLDIRPGERFLLFGKGWDRDPRVARYWRGHLNYELLPDLYRSTKIVLDDTAGPTRPYAFVNGRVFDALAAGALVVSDNEAGSRELFDGLLPVYRDRQDLRRLLDRYLDDEEGRTELVRRLRERVLESHTYAQLPGRILGAARDLIARPSVAFKVGVPSHEVAESWGDTHFARAMAAALAGIGFRTQIHILPEWDLPSRQDTDVVVHIRGLTTYAPKPAHVNVLWLISHPDDVSPQECSKYDLVLVASQSHADRLRQAVDVPVHFFPQATDGRRFVPGPADPALITDVLFLGNSRRQRRPAVEWAIERGIPVTIYGADWEDLAPADAVKADHFPNQRLPDLYRSAGIVLNDHWPDMRRHGFVSNRIFDVLGAGGVVVTDPVTGLEELFGDLVPTYDSPEELERVVADLLGDPDKRVAIAAKASEIVRSEHTFEKRAQQLAHLLDPLLASRSTLVSRTMTRQARPSHAVGVSSEGPESI